MQCERCQSNPASVHMQQFMHGKKVELHLCQDCAFKMDNPEMMVSLENIFKGFLDQLNTKYFNPQTMGGTAGGPPPLRPAKACSRCGMTFQKFKTGGRLGCDVCYTSFAKEVEVLLKNVQGGNTRHEGKYPRRMGAGLISKRQVSELRSQLKQAIEDENYEEAARLRDEIRAIEQTPTNSEVPE
ncbi:MAG: UvrB/UvrC motif-containing protein [Defluviitaleaceae bacterium]|nr:UvrB/UvrC motif-containing protein [Defluviitaleaceae bacterium]